MKKDESKILNLIRAGNNLRKKECGNFWNDFLNIIGDASATAELLDVPKEKIIKWFGVINKYKNEVKILDQTSDKQKNRVIKTGEIKMKSIREWLSENTDAFSSAEEMGLSRPFAGGVKVDRSVATFLNHPLDMAIGKLKSKPEFENASPDVILKELMAIIISKIYEIHGTNMTQSMVRKAFDDAINSPEEPAVAPEEA